MGSKYRRTSAMRKSTKKTAKRRRWSMKYKRSIDCSNPKGFSQRQHCLYGRKPQK